jgi:hypothetical protein
MSTPIKPYAVGTPVIVVRATRVMNDPANPIIIGKISAKLEPWQGEPRYTLEGNDQLAHFHREICTTRREAIAKIGKIQRAEEQRVKDATQRAYAAVTFFDSKPAP